MSTDGNAGRILRNTVSLYFRMIFLTLISLYTVRVILQVLGDVDYGIYNVVGGFVGLFAFFSSTVTVASQRFFAVSIARNDRMRLRQVFSCNLLINAGFSVCLLLLAETVGLWFVTNILQIPEIRREAAFWVYQYSILTFAAGLMESTFLAVLIAEERMGIYSAVSVAEGGAKLLVAYLLSVGSGDKLELYGLLLFMVAVIIDGIYILYCIKKFPYVRFQMCKDKAVYREIFAFTNWNTIGAVAAVLRDHGINIVINIFFGPAVNAARGIAVQINSVVMSFAVNFMNAVNPQITKSYAGNETERFFHLICIASKISYLLLLFLTLPLAFNLDYLLQLWLVEPPEHTAVFAVLVLIDALVISATNPLMTAVQATGKVKRYQLTVGGAALLHLPLAVLLLQWMEDPVIPFASGIGISFLMGVLRVINLNRLCGFPWKVYIGKVLLPLGLVTAVFAAADGFLFSGAESFLNLLGNGLGSAAVGSILIWFLGLSGMERGTLRRLILKRK